MKKFFLFTILTILAISMILPFIIMFLISLSGNENIFTDYKNINLSFCAYKNVFDSIPVIKYFLNSLIVALFTTIGQVIIAALAGYGFARLKFWGKDTLFFIIILTMMVPPQVNIVPLFYLMSKLGWINTYQALIVPGIFGGFGIYMMKNYFTTFSKDLEEAAKLDGCNVWQIFSKIALPCAMPAIATLSIFTFVTTWNSFMWPMIVLNSRDMMTIQVGLSTFQYQYNTQYGPLMAGTVISVLPTLLLFLFAQKYYIQGIAFSGSKD